MLLLSSCSKRTNHNSRLSTISIPEVVIKDIVEQKNYISESDLGSATFKLDEKYAVTKDFLADGNSLTLELSDQSDVKWTLMIPGNALLNPQTIIMTALSNVTSTEYPSMLTGGIRLEPDGLQFLSPATLTIYGANLNSQSMLFEGNNSGSELNFAYMNQSEDSTISSLIFHFSSAFVSERPDIDELAGEAKKEYEAAMEAAKKLLKEPLKVSTPTSFDFRCKNKEDLALEPVGEYIKALMNPEEEITSRLIKVKRMLSFLGKEGGNLENDKYLTALYMRLRKMLTSLLWVNGAKKQENIIFPNSKPIMIMKPIQLY